MEGFFKGSRLATLARQPLPQVARCGACGLHKTCLSPKMTPTGRGRRKILIVGEAPGEDEDKQDRQFVGKTGQRLRKMVREIGYDLEEDCWLTNALICRPPNNEIQKKEMIDWCRPNLMKTIAELKPNVIIPLGTPAVKSVIEAVWRDDPGGVTTWAGFTIPCQQPNLWVCPTFHPSFIERHDNPVAEMTWKEHLTQAFAKETRPWNEVPDYKRDLLIEFDHHTAASVVRRLLSTRNPLAFDFETTALKPEGEGFEIVSCSVSDGLTSIAFPWYGEAIDAMEELIDSDVPKIASNMKAEERWSRWFFGRGVRNWFWDTMLAAHWMDSRPGITSIKFQSFVWLGFPAYDDHIKPYLKAAKGSQVNRIAEVDLRDLLRYNALDSLLEHKVAFIQRRVMGIGS